MHVLHPHILSVSPILLCHCSVGLHFSFRALRSDFPEDAMLCTRGRCLWRGRCSWLAAIYTLQTRRVLYTGNQQKTFLNSRGQHTCAILSCGPHSPVSHEAGWVPRAAERTKGRRQDNKQDKGLSSVELPSVLPPPPKALLSSCTARRRHRCLSGGLGLYGKAPAR
ncbi:hypothetical protein BD626DRAFT_186918 [Schizophyllum amplum]|uniref:Uncharacterized protein n=1 Tax=Schizophyllum amplum TaxID=97359 RepID=A0A550C0I9_9AGAR|nr:hypothetical protein BD626DRAFT_186918 [Auriculariopsis ampla]